MKFIECYSYDVILWSNNHIEWFNEYQRSASRYGRNFGPKICEFRVKKYHRRQKTTSGFVVAFTSTNLRYYIIYVDYMTNEHYIWDFDKTIYSVFVSGDHFYTVEKSSNVVRKYTMYSLVVDTRQFTNVTHYFCNVYGMHVVAEGVYYQI
jgi:hypothetical protein